MIKANWIVTTVPLPPSGALRVEALGSITVINPLGSEANIEVDINGNIVPLAEGGSITSPLINGIYEARISVARFTLTSDEYDADNPPPADAKPKADIIISYAQFIG